MIEYKPREPRNKIIFPNAARTLLGIQQVGLDNLGICLTSAIPCTAWKPRPTPRSCASTRAGTAIDVNDNFRGWDDDMVVGSVHLVETFEFFYTLRKNNWDGVWQQINSRSGRTAWQPPRRPSASSRLSMGARRVGRGALRLRRPLMAPAAQRLVQDVLLSSMAGHGKPGRERMTALLPSTSPCPSSTGCHMHHRDEQIATHRRGGAANPHSRI